MDEENELRLARLVEAYQEAPDDAGLRTELANLLVPVVEPMAQTIACRLGHPMPAEVAAEAVWELIGPRYDTVPRICRWDTERPFESLARTALKNIVLDRLRQIRRRAHGSLQDHDRPTAADESERRAQEKRVTAFYDTPFSRADLRILAGWGAEYRLELTLIGGVWVKFLPLPDTWLHVRSEYETERGVRLPDPFTPAPFLTADEPGRRISRLAPVLGYIDTNGRNKLARRWERNHRLLWELECMLDWPRPDKEP